MAEWETLAGKFSQSEYKVIKEYLEKNNLKPTQLVQNAVKFYIPFFTGVNTFKDPRHLFWLEFIQEINKVLTSKKYQSDVEKIILKLLNKYSIEEIENETKELEQVEIKQKELEKKHDPVGRPKQIRKRGRPKMFE